MTIPRSLRPQAVVGAAALAALLGCARPEVGEPRIACAAVALPDAPDREPGAGDTLELVVVFDSLPRGAGGVRLRVDALAEPGVLRFAALRPGSAAAGMTLDVPARYHGCAAMAPHGLELRSPYPTRRKAWLRASTDRPVRLRVAGGDRTLDPVVALPGQSALVSWAER